METETLFYDTEWIGDEEARTLDQRLGRCYELAAFALALGSAPRDAHLVHGSVHALPAPVRIKHAWLELPDGHVWEPARAHVWHGTSWWTYARPVIDVRYTVAEARRRIIDAGHWGPWETSDVGE